MVEPVVVEAQSTPNPNAYKFTVNRSVAAGGSRSFTNAVEARGSQLAARLFEVPGVLRLFFMQDFITISRAPDVSWDALLPILLETVQSYFQSSTEQGP